MKKGFIPFINLFINYFLHNNSSLSTLLLEFAHLDSEIVRVLGLKVPMSS